MKLQMLFLMLAIGLPSATHAQLVKCVSKDGKVEYARDCPPGTTEHQTGVRSGPTTTSDIKSPVPAQQSAAERDVASKKRMIEEERAKQKDAGKAEAEERRRSACENAQRRLATLQDGTRIEVFNPKTKEREIMDDAARAANLELAKKHVGEHCK